MNESTSCKAQKQGKTQTALHFFLKPCLRPAHSVWQKRQLITSSIKSSINETKLKVKIVSVKDTVTQKAFVSSELMTPAFKSQGDTNTQVSNYWCFFTDESNSNQDAYSRKQPRVWSADSGCITLLQYCSIVHQLVPEFWNEIFAKGWQQKIELNPPLTTPRHANQPWHKFLLKRANSN